MLDPALPVGLLPFLKPKYFLKPPLSSFNDSESSSLKSGDGLMNFLRLFKRKNAVVKSPNTMTPPIEPTNPPMSFALLLEPESPESSEPSEPVGTLIKVVRVVPWFLIVVEYGTKDEDSVPVIKEVPNVDDVRSDSSSRVRDGSLELRLELKLEDEVSVSRVDSSSWLEYELKIDRVDISAVSEDHESVDSVV